MPYPNITLPTYAAFGPQVIDWAAARELVSADGSPLRATPLSQHGKTVEEIGEASEALMWFSSASTSHSVAGERLGLAIELGDILVTLTIQAAMHGKTLEQCKTESGRLTSGYGSDWHLGKPGQPPMVWERVGEWAALLGDALANLDSPYRFDIAGLIGAVACCTEEIARIELSLMGAECLEMALAKIDGRRGETVNGVFVKEERV